MSLSVHLSQIKRPRTFSLKTLAVIVVLTAATGLLSVPIPIAAAGERVPVLGARNHAAPYGSGWGVAHPRRIDNGGVPSGIVFRIRWRHWGANRAIGRGLTYIYKPGGGYYKRPGRIVLRGQRLDNCRRPRPAYTRLVYRVARRPDGPVGQRWRRWGPTNGNICRRI